MKGTFIAYVHLRFEHQEEKGSFRKIWLLLELAQDIGCYTHYFKRPYFVQKLKKSQNVSIEFSHFGIFQQFLSFLD